MRTRKRLNDVFPNWLTGSGIFGALQTLEVPWQDDNMATSLDIAYHGEQSGDKYISPLVSKIMDGDTLTTAEKTTLANSIFAVYGRNWTELWDTMLYEYDPISNYDMEEKMTNDKTEFDYGSTETRTDRMDHAHVGYDEKQVDLTDTRRPDITREKSGKELFTHGEDIERIPTNLQTTTTNSVKAFNSSDWEESDKSVTGETGTEKTEHSGTDTTEFEDYKEEETGSETVEHDGTDRTEYASTLKDDGTITNEHTGRDTHTRNYTLTRKGNIGVTTSQQMIESQRELWIWNYFRDVIFPDLDRFLTLAIY